VALVTGAARGIGLAIARWFHAHDWRLALIDVDRQTLARTAADWGNDERVLALPCDVSLPAEVAQAVQATAVRFGRIDTLVNNAGVAVFKPILQTSFDEWRQVMATNLDGPFICTQAVVPWMLRQGRGSVVHIASISGLRASTLRVAYGTSKAALIHLMRQQAAELGAQGIRVNAVAPGPVETAMAAQVHTPAIRAGYQAAIRWAAMAHPRRSLRRWDSCAAMPRATSTVRCSPSTAVLTPPASASMTWLQGPGDESFEQACGLSQGSSECSPSTDIELKTCR
jgi:NAD(P)-dependent dehydrogenase (short-subunit alcohol dehydrogenase family)